jgi:cell wall-associated NlpC family hydrolase
MPAEPRALRRARTLIGTPFRLHGRDRAHGIDCVGLVAVSHNCPDLAPTGYTMRNSENARWLALLDKDLCRRAGAMRPGDLVMMIAGPAQLHLGIFSGNGLIHADAGLRRVVETPGPLRWPVIGIWSGRRRRAR